MGYYRSGLDCCFSAVNLFFIPCPRIGPHTLFQRPQYDHRSVFVFDISQLWYTHVKDALDEHALIPELEVDDDGSVRNPYIRFATTDGIPEIYDLPIGLVNRVLYSKRS
jgi:hypothetical protein